MKFGLSEKDFSYLIEKLIRPLQMKGAKVFIFGSRATGKYKKFSDIDLLFKESSPAIPSAEIYQLLTSFEESSFPYKIDLVSDKELASSYRSNVEKDKVEIL